MGRSGQSPRGRGAQSGIECAARGARLRAGPEAGGGRLGQRLKGGRSVKVPLGTGQSVEGVNPYFVKAQAKGRGRARRASEARAKASPACRQASDQQRPGDPTEWKEPKRFTV